MDCRVLPLRQLPHQPKLFLEYLDHFEKVKSFYAHPPAMQEVARAARKLEYPEDRRGGGGSLFWEQKNAPGGGAEGASNFDRLGKGAGAGGSGEGGGVFSGAADRILKKVTGLQKPE